MNLKRQLPKIIGTVIVLGVAVMAISFMRDFLNAPVSSPKKGPQQITILTPPPPPKMEEKPPEPEVKQEEDVALAEPEALDNLPDEATDEPPAGADLGVDAEGGAGGDGFGLIGRKGGRGLLAGSGNPFAYYGTQLQRQIENALLDDKNTRKQAYSVVAKVWLRSDGSILRAELATKTGNRDMDDRLIAAIMTAQSLAQAPPQDMPQPIRMRISSRM